MATNNEKAVWSFRITITVLVTVALFILGGIKSDVNKIDTKLFNHLTNDEIHIPRSVVVTNAEFRTYTKYIDQLLDRLLDAIQKLK